MASLIIGNRIRFATNPGASLTKTGFLFKANDSNDLTNKLSHIFELDETTLKSMGNEGRKNAINKFNVEKMCFSTYSEYKKLINA